MKLLHPWLYSGLDCTTGCWAIQTHDEHHPESGHSIDNGGLQSSADTNKERPRINKTAVYVDKKWNQWVTIKSKQQDLLPQIKVLMEGQVVELIIGLTMGSEKWLQRLEMNYMHLDQWTSCGQIGPTSRWKEYCRFLCRVEISGGVWLGDLWFCSCDWVCHWFRLWSQF